MAPFEWSGTGLLLISGVLGFGFGFVLERSGFGDSRKLAAQFYLTDLTVLKVMFTAIIVAMLLMLWAGALSLIDLSRVWIQPTYLGSGILGGFILGLGFIIGGYCPGTSLVASATLKLDGIVFVVGLFVGIFAFGETAPQMWDFFQQAGFRGTYRLDQWLGISLEMTAVLVTMMAVFAFWGAERVEESFARGNGTGRSE